MKCEKELALLREAIRKGRKNKKITQEELAEKLEADELMDSWEVSGDLFSTACEVVPDKQGRILLPAELRAYAGLEKDVTIIGNRNHAEIWATDVWNARRAAVSNEQRAARLRSLHI